VSPLRGRGTGRSTLVVLGLALGLVAWMGLGEIGLRLLDARLGGVVERIGWGWARLLLAVLFAAAASDWLARRRRPNLRRR
jgi:hypothetical protein